MARMLLNFPLLLFLKMSSRIQTSMFKKPLSSLEVVELIYFQKSMGFRKTTLCVLMKSCVKISLKVSKFQKQICLFSFESEIAHNFVFIFALASKNELNQKMKALYYINQVVFNIIYQTYFTSLGQKLKNNFVRFQFNTVFPSHTKLGMRHFDFLEF